jgi:hypothetical protein
MENAGATEFTLDNKRRHCPKLFVVNISLTHEIIIHILSPLPLYKETIMELEKAISRPVHLI